MGWGGVGRIGRSTVGKLKSLGNDAIDWVGLGCGIEMLWNDLVIV